LLPLLFDPFSSGPVEGVKAGALKVIAILALLAWAATRVTAGRRQDNFTPQAAGLANPGENWRFGLLILLPLFIYTGIYLLATLTSQDPRTSWLDGDTYQGLLTVLCLAVLFALSIELFKNPQKIELGNNLILLGNVPVAVYGIVQFFGLDPLAWQTTSPSRVHSTVGYSLALGTYLAMVVPFTLARLLQVETRQVPRKLIAYSLLLVLQVACLLFTLSRGALLALVVGILLFLALLALKSKGLQRINGRILVGIAGVTLVGAVILILLSSGWGAFLAGESGLSQQQMMENRQVSNTGRLALWKLTLPMIGERPWLGYGPDTYAQAFIQHYPEEAETNPLSLQYWDAHNLFLSQAMYAGLLGLAAFVGLVIYCYWRMLTCLRQVQEHWTILTLSALLASTSAFLVAAQFNPAGVVPSVLFWLVMAMGVGLSTNGQTDVKNGGQDGLI
jgi:putative inorganic carbon (hco3(-)) transporter